MKHTPASLATRFVGRLKQYMAMSGKLPSDLADVMGTTPAFFKTIEMGLRLPSWEQLCALSELAGVDPTWWIPATAEADLDTDALTRMAYYLDRQQAALRELYSDARAKCV